MKKLLSILLVLAMVLALAPAVSASEEASVGKDAVEAPEELGQIEETEEEAAGPIDGSAGEISAGPIDGSAGEILEEPINDPSEEVSDEPVGSPAEAPARGGEVVDSGTCGEKLTWSLTDNGLLTISGTGAIMNCSGGAPWSDYIWYVKNVDIRSGVTAIGSRAFSGARRLKSVTIPDSVTYISIFAFYGCPSLTDVYYTGTEAQWRAFRSEYASDGLDGCTIHCSDAVLPDDPASGEPPPETSAPEPPALSIAEDAKSARATGDYDGLYARAALILDSGGASGLYVTQVAVDIDGSIVIPAFRVPGLTVKGVNVSLVPTLADIQSPTPTVEATATKMLSA